jgi:hypothetical protein
LDLYTPILRYEDAEPSEPIFEEVEDEEFILQEGAYANSSSSKEFSNYDDFLFSGDNALDEVEVTDSEIKELINSEDEELQVPMIEMTDYKAPSGAGISDGPIL